jgi:hypothetical protein
LPVKNPPRELAVRARGDGNHPRFVDGGSGQPCDLRTLFPTGLRPAILLAADRRQHKTGAYPNSDRNASSVSRLSQPTAGNCVYCLPATAPDRNARAHFSYISPAVICLHT